jgi:peroxiredoxin
MAGRLNPGDRIEARKLTDIARRPVAMPDSEKLIHLQFRRFAGCPICNLHLRSFSRRLDEIEAAGVREVVVFHSTREEMMQYESELPFAAIADPEKRLYAEFGVEAGLRALLDPRAWTGILRGVASATAESIRRGKLMGNTNPHGGRIGLPADFLIAPDGRVRACKYGTHADDQWSVDEMLAQAR